MLRELSLELLRIGDGREELFADAPQTQQTSGRTVQQAKGGHAEGISDERQAEQAHDLSRRPVVLGMSSKQSGRRTWT